jgi:hypothetical protein
MKTASKNKALTISLISIGAIALIGGVYLGIKALKGTKGKPSGGGGGVLPTKTNAGGYNAPTPAPSGGGGSSSSGVFPLHNGSKDVYPNEQVRNLQSALAGLGASDLVIDGIFGSKTQQALMAQTGKSTVDSQAELDALVNQQAYMKDTSSWIGLPSFSFN